MAVRNYDHLLEAFHSEASLDDLRQDSLSLLVLAAVVIACGLGLASLPASLPWVIRAWAIVLGLGVTAALTDLARTAGLRAGSAVMIAGLLAVETAALYLYEGLPLGGGFALVPLAATVLLGWRWGAATGLAAMATVLAVAMLTPQTLTLGGATVVIFLIWGSVVLAWLLSRPIQLTLDWSWHSYVQALQKTEELRDHQAELGRLSKSLVETVQRLELLNQELERARQAAEEARQLKSEFAATISHELRTPLNLVIGFSEMLIRHLGARSQITISRDELETIYRNATHMSDMIDDILDLAQIEARRMALHRQRASLVEIVAEATATVTSLISRVGLELRVELEPNTPEVFVDRTRVRQILVNLLSNAIRSTDEGGITLSARHAASDVVVSVADTGMGISPEDVTRLFDDFSRVAPAGVRRGRSGLGLAVSKRFAELHGGSMWVESTPGQGSVFSFSLPVCEAVVSIPFERDWERLVGNLETQLRTVIVVGKSSEGVRVFQRYLDDCQVLAASDLAEAERLSQEHPVHAFIAVDQLPPGGWPRLQGPNGTIPVFECPLHTLATRLEPGVADCLVKPVTHRQVKDALQHLGGEVHDVLIVDDEPEMVNLLAEMVKAASRRFRVSIAHDGSTGLKRLRDHPADAVLLDLLMPNLDGYQVLEAMRADPRLKHVPVIVVTGQGQHSEVVRASGLSVSQSGGLGIGEVMGLVKASLDALYDHTARPNTGPEPLAARPG